MSLQALLDKIERFDLNGALIVQGTSGATSTNTTGGNDMDVSGRAVATATGYTYTNPASGSGPNSNASVDVLGLQLPKGNLVLLDFAQVRSSSELSWQYLKYTLIVGDVANSKGGQAKTKALEALTRPLDRDGRIPLGLLVSGDKFLRVAVTNDDFEAPHFAEARVAGWYIRNTGVSQADLDLLIRTLLSRATS